MVESPPSDEKKTKKEAILIHGHPVRLIEDWEHGIGGGLWSTGLALAKYLSSNHASSQLGSMRRVLELGSGNGFLSVCYYVAATTGIAIANEGTKSTLERIVVTDTKEHLPLIQKTIQANSDIVDADKVTVEEYMWGEDNVNSSPELEQQSFDLILGSDLAYRDELHDPLIAAFHKFASTSRTVILLGVTMTDTKPIFFDKLSSAGFDYERLADHLLDPSFRGTTFGIFVIRRTPTSR